MPAPPSDDLAGRLRAFLAGDDRDALDAIPAGWSIAELVPRLRRARTADPAAVGGYAQVRLRPRWWEQYPAVEMWALDPQGRPLLVERWDRARDRAVRASGVTVRRFGPAVDRDVVREVWPDHPGPPGASRT